MQPNAPWTAGGLLLLALTAAPPLDAQQAPPAGAAREVPAPPGGTSIRGITPTGELVALSAAEIADRHIFTNDGEDLGAVERVVVGKADNVPHAVVEIGGFLGIGAKPIAIPFEMLRLQGNDIYIIRNFDADQLKAQFPYSDARYRTVADNRIIADVIGVGAAEPAPAAAPGRPPAAAAFEAADLNRDGYITMSEAEGNEQISHNWQAMDRNSDGLIDAAEFSTFEQSRTPTDPGR